MTSSVSPRVCLVFVQQTGQLFSGQGIQDIAKTIHGNQCSDLQLPGLKGITSQTAFHGPFHAQDFPYRCPGAGSDASLNTRTTAGVHAGLISHGLIRPEPPVSDGQIKEYGAADNGNPGHLDIKSDAAFLKVPA